MTDTPEDLQPQPDGLFYLDIHDEMFTYYLSQARALGMVFSIAVMEVVAKMYHEHDYLKRCEVQGKSPQLQDTIRKEVAGMAWLVRAALEYVPSEIQQQPVPPQPIRPNKGMKQTKAALKARKEAAHKKDVRYQQDP
jgi:hypothetical protein